MTRTASTLAQERMSLLTETRGVRDARGPRPRHEEAHKVPGRESAFFEELFSSSPEGIVIYDRDGRICRVNETFCRMFGYEPEEVIGEILDSLVATGRYFEEAASFTRANLAGERAFSETKRVRRDGSLFDVEVMALPILIDGSVEAAYSIYRDITEQRNNEKELLKSIRRTRKIWVQTLRLVAALIENRDPSISGHHRRVAALCRAMSLRMELHPSRRGVLRFAACLHDIGKIHVPSEILSKPGRLTDLELGLIREHAETGYNLLKEIDLPKDVAEIVRQHHERMDGSGYPRGLRGEQIILEARMISVADVVEAMSSHRPYRPAPGLERALGEIADGRGIVYDPAAVDACIAVFREGFSFTRFDKSR